MKSDYIVVMRDHAGDWHCVAGPMSWGEAIIAHATAAYTLSAIDYYEDFPPSVVKIIRNGEDYATAPALGGPVP